MYPRLAGVLYRLLSMLAVLGREQVSNVMSHVICQHGRMSGLRTLQCSAWRAAAGVQNWVETGDIRWLIRDKSGEVTRQTPL